MWCIREATDYKDCLDQVRQFTQKAFAASSITRVAGSAGSVYGASASENSNDTEEFTIKCTTGGGDGVAKFSVTGDGATGSAAEATAGEPYSIDECSFIIISEGDTFTTSDEWTFTTDASTAEWVEDDYFTNYNNTGESWLVQHGIGAGSDEVYGSWWTVSDTSTYWNMGLSGQTGYNDGYVDGSTDLAHGITAQPGYHPYYVVMNEAPNTFTFYCIATSRHIKIIPLIGSSHGSTYTGWFLPHSTPSQWGYPMFNGGSTDNESEPVGARDSGHTCYWSAFDGALHGAVDDNTIYREIDTFSPRHYGSFAGFRSSLDQNVLLWPCVPIHEGSNNVYGELEGVYWPSPYTWNGTTQGVLTPGSVIVTDTVTALCFQDVTADGAGNIIAMDLMGD